MNKAEKIQLAQEYISLHNRKIREYMEWQNDVDWLDIYNNELEHITDEGVEICRFKSHTGNPIIFHP